MPSGTDRITAPKDPRIAIRNVSAPPLMISFMTVGSGGTMRPRKSVIRGPAEKRRDSSTSVVMKDQRTAPAMNTPAAKPPNPRDLIN